MLRMPTLETARLVIRPLTMDDLDAVYQILDVELADADTGGEGAGALDDRRRWLQWTVLNYEELARLYQPPFGERGVALRETGQLIGLCGYVPYLNAFGQLPSFRAGQATRPGLTSIEFGLYWAIAPAHQRRGYATEAARAMLDHAFSALRLARVVATTSHDNAASIGVMRRLGMRIETNPCPDPPWLQVAGVLENDRAQPAG